MKKLLQIVFASLAFSLVTAHAQAAYVPTDKSEAAATVVASVTEKVKGDKSQILKFISEAIAKNPEFAADIVGAAIFASNASPALIAQIKTLAVKMAPAQEVAINKVIENRIASAPTTGTFSDALNQTEFDNVIDKMDTSLATGGRFLPDIIFPAVTAEIVVTKP